MLPEPGRLITHRKIERVVLLCLEEKRGDIMPVFRAMDGEVVFIWDGKATRGQGNKLKDIKNHDFLHRYMMCEMAWTR